jgi:hypothetical protein
VATNLPAVTYTRTVSSGQPISGSFRVESYATRSIGDITIPVQRVDTYQDYIAGCKEHERCLGHFCVTPRGTVLLPQKLATTLGIMSNKYAKMVESVYSRDTHNQELDYRANLRSMMLGKTGKMRGDMPAGAADTSGREVISICWDMPRQHFAIPRRVANNMKVLRVEKNPDTGLYNKHYTEDHLREGDMVIAVRPPSLWAGNVQPMRIVLWEHECFGLHPSHAAEFHADHDGDEMHITFVTLPKTLEQCEQWKPLTEDVFQAALNKVRLPATSLSGDENRYNNFMVHSTLSVRELMEGVPLPEIAKVSRVKENMAAMFVERMRNPTKVYSDFCKESIRGIKDVMAQQLNQGSLGDMSRQARLAAACVSYAGEGVFHIKTSTETIRSVNIDLIGVDPTSDLPLGGNSCMRAISAICAVAQQAALDSHRVSQSVAPKMDLIGNLIRGGPTSLVVFNSYEPHNCIWKYKKDDLTYAVVNNDSVKDNAIKLVAAYNPVVLKAAKLMGGDVRAICKNGIQVVCNYYGIKLSYLELESATELLSYKPEAHISPITTKEGLLARNMRWMVVLFATHYGRLKGLQHRRLTERFVRPETITDATAFCNFDYI